MLSLPDFCDCGQLEDSQRMKVRAILGIGKLDSGKEHEPRSHETRGVFLSSGPHKHSDIGQGPHESVPHFLHSKIMRLD